MTSYPQYIHPLPVDVRVKPPSHDFQDPSSHSWPGRHFVTHIDLDFTIDFTAKLIHGIANIHFELLSGSTTLTLDVRGITIKSIIYGKDRHLPYTIDHLDSSIGAALNISLPSNIGILDIPFHTITIAYTTPGNGDGHPAGGALDWLSPEQTSSGEPFAFTQCQSIHARSIIPCQDTSTVKSTYNALGRVAPPFDHLTLVMSAQHVSSKETKNGVSFSCGVPIPSYLIAFACGKLEYRNLSKRCAVWAEPSIIDKAESEFSETDSMLESAENIAGPYVWGRYDLIVLPGSFPYGG